MAETIGVSTFYGGIVNGTSKSSAVAIAEEVVNALPFEGGTFVVRHRYAGERLVYGFIYGGKSYGSITIQKYEGTNQTVDLKNYEYTART